MLRRLTISNVALIEHAELEFDGGLNVLTGETGAGKSVILDSLDFALGAKADKGMVRTGADSCTVTAEFTADDAVFPVLEEIGVEPEESIVITRKLNSDGRGALRLNGCPVTAAMLRRVTSLLVDVHGQSEHFFLLKESNQLRLLDEIAGEAVSKKKETVRALLKERREIVAELGRLGGDEGSRERRLDILRYQIDELERADLKEGEEEELTSLRARYRNAEKILSGLAAARDYLAADGGSADCARDAERALNQVTRFDDRYAALAERLSGACAEIRDIADTAQSYADELDMDERDAERVESRLDEIKTIEKKYGGSVGAALEFLRSAREEEELLTDSGARAEELNERLGVLDGKLYEACLALTEERKRAAAGFTARVTEELKTLNIPSARFEVQFDGFSREDAPRATSEGLGGVRFLFSANAGEPVKELGKIISGGEMSRFMLAVKAQLSSAGGIGTYVFDEIDAGIGGNTAKAIAEKFAKISAHVQVIAVTHLARIAAYADRQFVIEKREEGEKTRTSISEAAGEARLCELARLVGGDSEHVLEHARDLLKEGAFYKKSL